MSKIRELEKCKSLCLKHKVKVYPVFIDKNCTIAGEHYNAGYWYVCVNNNGVEMLYKKPIFFGKILSSDKFDKSVNWISAINNTWVIWSNKIKKTIK